MQENELAYQLRDINGYLLSTDKARPFFCYVNQYFTLTADTVKEVEVPNGPFRNYVAFFEYSLGADVWVSPSNDTVLTVPSGTVSNTLAQLRPAARLVVPGQTLQLIYSQTAFPDVEVGVGISYYANTMG